MSETQPIGAAASARPDVRAAIARASQATGVDFGYLLGQAKIESSLDPQARAATSSAAGLYQFTKGTWLSTLDRHGAEHGYGWAEGAITTGRVRDPALRQQVLALRYDPDAAALMAAELASDNATALKGTLGRDPDPAELYLAHFLGADGAGRFLTALTSDPDQSAAMLFPKAAEANRAIFFGSDGAPRSLGEVMAQVRGKMAKAMDERGQDPVLPSPAGTGWGWGDNANIGPLPIAEGRSAHPSMAETLAATFGDRAATPPNVRSAYGKLRAFGL